MQFFPLLGVLGSLSLSLSDTLLSLSLAIDSESEAEGGERQEKAVETGEDRAVTVTEQEQGVTWG